MAEHGLKNHDLAASLDAQLFRKMTARAVKGRRLTPGAKLKVLTASNK